MEDTHDSKEKGGFYCEICNKRMRSRYRLKLHLPVHTGEKNYICGVCKKGFQQKWNLITHMGRVHSKEKPFKCTDCDKAFGYSSHFKRHVKTHFLEKIKAPENVKKRILNPHKCEFCEKSFETNYRLDLHMRKHTGTKPYVCDKCSKSFTTKRLITIHMKKKHQVEYDYICEHCGETFPDRSTIRIHLQTGHKICDIVEGSSIKVTAVERKELLPCEVCGKTITRASMKKHLNIHYRSRVYACNYCSKEFLESGQRAVHERKHTGDKPYLCDVCGRPHSQYGNLLTHRKRYHNLVEKSPTLWKKGSLKEGCEQSEVMEAEAGTEPDEDCTVKSGLDDASDIIKPTYTGNETIEEFLNIASDYISKKFNESKSQNKKSRKTSDVESDEDVPLSSYCKSKSTPEGDLNVVEEREEEVEEPQGNNDQNSCSCVSSDEGNDHDSFENSVISPLLDDENEVQDPPKVSKEKPITVAKRKLNNAIFKRITEDLKDDPEIQTVLKKMKKTEPDTDKLKIFLRLVKKIPDNSIIQTDHDVAHWHCWMCTSKFETRHLLTRHLLVHEPEEERPYKCEICEKRFTQSNNYKEHVMSHTKENQFYCEKCGSGFRHKSHFNIHMRRHNNQKREAPEKKHQCVYCDKTFVTSFHKKEHERTHTKEKPYLCKSCGQQFGALSTLNRHQKVHTSITFQCDICLKFFRGKTSLKRHIKAHSGVERVDCECGKSFGQKTTLNRHKKICGNRKEPVIKPFSCLICVKKFLTQSDLKRHTATHDATKKFKCHLCSINLKTDETYKRHVRRHQEALLNARDSFCCGVCNCMFKSMKTLRRHIVKTHLENVEN